MNTSKCIVMHTGHQGTDTYTLNKSMLPFVQTYDDLEVIVSRNFKLLHIVVRQPPKILELCDK